MTPEQEKATLAFLNSTFGDEPVICSQGGIPYNKAHLDAKDAEIERLRKRIGELEMILINHRLRGCLIEQLTKGGKDADR